MDYDQFVEALREQALAYEALWCSRALAGLHGKFAMIRNRELVATFDSMGEALKSRDSLFYAEPVLIRQIRRETCRLEPEICPPSHFEERSRDFR